MPPFWLIEGRDVETRFKGRGDDFRALLDALIRTAAQRAGLPDACVRLNSRGDIPDGGVDALVEQGSSTDESSYLTTQSVWQYKSGGWKETQPRCIDHLLAGALLERLRAGFAFRLCVPECRAEQQIRQRVKNDLIPQLAKKKIKSGVRKQAMILTADDIAGWLSRYPALVLAFFPERHPPEGLDWQTWGQSITRPARNYVSVPDWEGQAQLIADHTNLAGPADQAVLRVSGPAGVGKTRLVYETLATALPVPESVVLYVLGGQPAATLAAHLVGLTGLKVILVADECLGPERGRIEELLRGHTDRLRVIAIDNAGVPQGSGDPHPWLDRMPDDRLIAVLQANYGGTQTEGRLREVVALTGGFVLFAIDVCRSMTEGIPRTVLDYLDRRFPTTGDRREVLRLLSLLSYVGWQGQDAIELEALLAATRSALTIEQARRVAHDIHDEVGFVGRGPFLYVTPEILAHALFAEAWRRCISPDGGAHAFAALEQADPLLLERLSERLARIPGLEEERAVLGRYFRGALAGLTSDALADPAIVRRLATYVEADPDGLLPVLRERLEAQPPETLGAIGRTPALARDRRGPHWGPRRYLVWLLERLAAIDTYFDDASALLLLLAEHESEPGIGNNATAIWKQLHWIAGAGTMVPFARRLDGLRHWLDVDRSRFGPLVLAALEGALTRHGWRIVHARKHIGGREVPAQWHPSVEEIEHSRSEVLALLAELAQDPDFGSRAREVILEHTFDLLLFGHVAALRDVFANPSDVERVRLRRRLAEVLERGRPDPPTRSAIETWLADSAPIGLRDRMIELAGRPTWRHVQPAGDPELAKIAQELLAEPAILLAELDHLTSGEAHTAGALGQALAVADTGQILLDPLVADGLERSHVSALLLGYLQEARRLSPDLSGICPRLDVTDADPRAILALAVAAGTCRPVQRAVRLVRGGRLALEALVLFRSPAVRGELTPQQLVTLLELLLEQPTATTVGLAIDLVFLAKPPLDDPDLYQAIWTAIEWAPAGVRLFHHDGPMGSHEWCEVVARLAHADAARAMDVAARAVCSRGVPDPSITRLVGTLADQGAQALMAALGRRMLDPASRAAFFFGCYRELFAKIRRPAIKAWLNEHGVEGARPLARHVPPPTLVDGRPVLDALTEYLLACFGDDERVFREFSIGVENTEGFIVGELSEHARRRAAVAAAFLDHSLEPVRRWAAAAARRAHDEATQCEEAEAREVLEWRA